MRSFRSHWSAVAAFVLSLATAAMAYPDHNPLDDGASIASSWSATGNFGRLAALGPDSVRFTTGDVAQVRAEGDPRAIERLRFLVKDGQLLVGRRSGSEGPALPPATIYVTAPGIDAASLAGSGTVLIDRLAGETVSASVAGSGGLTVGEVVARTVKADVAGSGDLTLSGRSNDASLAIAGSGRLAGSLFTADTASVAVAGSGDMAFQSDGTVNATITGSGNVVVRGRASCSQQRAGSGSLRCGA